LFKIYINIMYNSNGAKNAINTYTTNSIPPGFYIALRKIDSIVIDLKL